MNFYLKRNGKLVLLIFSSFLISCLAPINKYSKIFDSSLIDIKIIDSFITKDAQRFSGNTISFGRDKEEEWIIRTGVPKNGHYFGIIECIFKNNSKHDYRISTKDIQVIIDGQRQNINHQLDLESAGPVFLRMEGIALKGGPAFFPNFEFVVFKGKTRNHKIIFNITENNISDATFKYLNLSPIKIEFKYKDVGNKSSSIDKYAKADLFDAIEKGDIEKVKKIIASEMDVNCKDTSGNTPLIVSSFYGHNKIVELLIAKGADLYMRNNHGTNALGFAADKGNTNIVKLLLASGVSPNLRINDQDGTALMVAAIHGHKDLASLLLEKGAKVSTKNQDGTTPLIFAAINGQVKIMQLLFKKGASANCHDIYGATPLMGAAVKGHSNVADFLITKGADINATLNTGDTAIMMAALNGHEEVVKVLLQNGADINLRNKKGQCALDFAKKKGNLRIIKLLQQ